MWRRFLSPRSPTPTWGGMLAIRDSSDSGLCRKYHSKSYGASRGVAHHGALAGMQHERLPFACQDLGVLGYSMSQSGLKALDRCKDRMSGVTCRV